MKLKKLREKFNQAWNDKSVSLKDVLSLRKKIEREEIKNELKL